MYIDSLIWSSTAEPNGMVPNGGSRNIDTKLQKTVAVNRREGNDMLRSSIFFLRFGCLWFVSMLDVSSHRPSSISVEYVWARNLILLWDYYFRFSCVLYFVILIVTAKFFSPPLNLTTSKEIKTVHSMLWVDNYHRIYSCRLYICFGR